MKSPTLLGLKAQLKSLAETIRVARRNHGARCYSERYEFRHLHVVYCLLRGRTIEQIEFKNRDDNKRDQKRIDRLMAEYQPKLEADRAAAHAAWIAAHPETVAS